MNESKENQNVISLRLDYIMDFIEFILIESYNRMKYHLIFWIIYYKWIPSEQSGITAG